MLFFRQRRCDPDVDTNTPGVEFQNPSLSVTPRAEEENAPVIQ